MPIALKFTVVVPETVDTWPSLSSAAPPIVMLAACAGTGQAEYGERKNRSSDHGTPPKRGQKDPRW